MNLDMAAKKLEELKINEYKTTGALNSRLRAFDSLLRKFFDSNEAENLHTIGIKSPKRSYWSTVFERENGNLKIIRSIRLGAYDLGSLLRKEDPEILISRDRNGSTKEGNYIPLYDFGEAREAIKEAMDQYMKALMLGPLFEHATYAQEICEGEPDYKAIVNVDYYPDRPPESFSNFHKDTQGNTLFVALHYLNPHKMLGPEYIDDSIPSKAAAHKDVQGKNIGRVNDVIGWDGKTSEGYTREHAPWQKITVLGKTLTRWPVRLIKALNQARRAINPEGRDEKVIYHQKLNRYGLIAFVDELIFHTTPLPRYRAGMKEVKKMTGVEREQKLHEIYENMSNVEREQELYETPSGVYKTYAYRRELTQSLEKAKLEGYLPYFLRSTATVNGGMSKRSFMRLWIAIVPNEFYVETVASDTAWHSGVTSSSRGKLRKLKKERKEFLSTLNLPKAKLSSAKEWTRRYGPAKVVPPHVAAKEAKKKREAAIKEWRRRYGPPKVFPPEK